LLQFRCEARPQKFDLMCTLVNTAKKAIPEMVVHFEGRADNCLSNLLVRKVVVKGNLKHFLSV
jgi:hypothetical protein